jgi:hypothetical protein
MQAALARLDALESDNAGAEVVDLNDDEYGSTDEEDHGPFFRFSIVFVRTIHLRGSFKFRELAMHCLHKRYRFVPRVLCCF